MGHIASEQGFPPHSLTQTLETKLCLAIASSFSVNRNQLNSWMGLRRCTVYLISHSGFLLAKQPGPHHPLLTRPRRMVTDPAAARVYVQDTRAITQDGIDRKIWQEPTRAFRVSISHLAQAGGGFLARPY
jgi:hypothetical protein